MVFLPENPPVGDDDAKELFAELRKLVRPARKPDNVESRATPVRLNLLLTFKPAANIAAGFLFSKTTFDFRNRGGFYYAEPQNSPTSIFNKFGGVDGLGWTV